MNLRYTPSAFQIRFGGCKGVVALAPDLGEEEKLQLRKSMEKFPSEHNQLEVVETSRPGLHNHNMLFSQTFHGYNFRNSIDNARNYRSE